MAQTTSQPPVKPRRVSVGFVGLMGLASNERERLWKGLERFANCSDDLDDFCAFGRAFPSFWPAHTENFDEALFKWGKVWDCDTEEWLDDVSEVPEGHRCERLFEAPALDWSPAFHKWFLFYRDVLRSVWSGEDETDSRWELSTKHFLLGLIDYNEQAIRNEHTRRASGESSDWPPPDELQAIWSEILTQFPDAEVDSLSDIDVDWKGGKLELMARSNFTRACFLLCRENWRARTCPRCKVFFIARRPKQRFCGTVCSAGSRLASKRKWWSSVGTKTRASEKKKSPKRSHRERKRR